MAARHTSLQERIHREVVRRNFQDKEMCRLAENDGSVEAIREQAIVLAPVIQMTDGRIQRVGNPEEYTRDQSNALFIIDTIDRLMRIERSLAEEAARRPIRSAAEMDGVTPLTRAMLNRDDTP